jgi:heterogeneous nuclear ribonucleoprotein A1/A3
MAEQCQDGPGSQGSEDEEKGILNKIFVGGIHLNTTEDSLKEHFAKYGTIVDHGIIKNRSTKQSRRFGFVKYSESTAVDEVKFSYSF